MRVVLKPVVIPGNKAVIRPGEKTSTGGTQEVQAPPPGDVFKPGVAKQQTPAKTAKLEAPVASEAELRHAEVSSRLVSIGYLLGLKTWGGHTHAEAPGPEVRQAIANDPQLLGVLTGERLYAPIDFPQLYELKLLTARLGTMTGQTLRLERNDAGRWFLVNRTVVETQTHAAGLPKLVGDVMNVHRGALDALQEKHGGDVSGLPAQLAKAGGNGSAPRHQQTVSTVGFITYANRQEQVDRLVTTLKSWDDNLALYGHQVTIRVTDDSTGEWSQKVREAVAGFVSKSGAKLEYVGADEKAALKEAVRGRLSESSKAKAWIADRKTTTAELNDMVDELFGDDTRKGPTRNRNLSMLNNRYERSLQMDDDNEPAALLVPANQVPGLTTVAGPQFASTGQPEDQVSKYLPLAVRVPVDLITHYLRSTDKVESPAVTGAGDITIAEVVSSVPRAVDMDFIATETANIGMRTANLVHAIDKPTLDTRSWAPMFVPEKYGPANDYVPWTAPVRDGDLIVTTPQNAALGIVEEEDPVYDAAPKRANTTVLQTELGGTRSSKASVLFDTMISQGYIHAMRELSGTLISPLPGEPYKVALARTILTELGKPKSTLVADALKTVLTSEWSDGRVAIAEDFIQRSRHTRGRLLELQAALAGPEQTDALRAAAAQWELGSGSFAPELPAPIPEADLASYRQEIAGAIGTLDRESVELRERFHLGEDDAKVVELLTAEILPPVRKFLRDYALSLMFADEILGPR